MRLRRESIDSRTVRRAGALSLLGALLLAVAALALRSSAPPPAAVAGGQERPPGPLSIEVTALELGTRVGLDKRVAEPVTVFAPGDTLYASVVTRGAADRVRLTARWSHEGRMLAETAQTIAPRGEATSEFNVRRPRGFAPGSYEVEILVDGAVAARRGFEVR